MELVLREQRPEAGDAVSFVFERPAGFEWQPGQYVGLRVEHPDADARGVTRTFTIASAPQEDVVMVTTRKRGDTSSLKRALLALGPGDTVGLHRPPGGDFVAPPSGEHVFIARGIGITPFRSMLMHLSRKLGQARVTLVYATGSDVVYREELDRLAARSPWLTLRYVLEPDVVTGPLLRETVTDGQGVWVAGPAVMVHSVTGLLAMAGVPDERVRTEAFPGY